MIPPPYPTVASNEIGWLTEEQMIEVDRIMIEGLHIELMQMMENAGRNLARLVLDGLDAERPARVVVFAGSGGNGGGGLVAARHLLNAGVDVAVVLSRPATELRGVPRHQLDILERMHATISHESMPWEANGIDVVIDALIGYSLAGAPHSRAKTHIETINALREGSGSTVVSLDTPSGLDVDTGQALGVAVSANATMTLALPKVALRQAEQVGQLYLADISVPPSTMQSLGAQPPDFSASSILRITT